MDLFEKNLPRAVQLAHLLIRSRLNAGEIAVDATVGNGHDTLFLAKIVGFEGQVLGFDIQPAAIDSTREKAAKLPQVKLHLAGHESAGEYLKEAPKAAMFNLGYLPGTDKQVITCADTTLRALDVLTSNLAPGGVITIVLYTGHEGGAEEAISVRQWCEGLAQEEFSVIEYGFVNQKNSPPSLIAIEKNI